MKAATCSEKVSRRKALPLSLSLKDFLSLENFDLSGNSIRCIRFNLRWPWRRDPCELMRPCGCDFHCRSFTASKPVYYLSGQLETNKQTLNLDASDIFLSFCGKKMSSGSARQVTHPDIQLVQNLIKRCLHLYLSPQEVFETLLKQEKIEPALTELVWQKLEDENREFFDAYYLRLMVKHQIMEFNRLLEQQVRMTHQINQSGITALPTSNGSQVRPMQQSSAYSGLPVKQETLHYRIDASSIPFINGGSSFNSMHTSADMPAHATRIDILPNMMLPQTSDIGTIQGINGGTVKLEAEYSASSQNMFVVDGNLMEERPTIGDASVAHFTNVMPNTQTLNDPLIDPDIFSFGFLSQIPQTFNLSDLTVDFTQSSDILDSFARSPFMVSGANNFPVNQEREPHGDSKGLESISEGLSYDDFVSE